MLYFFLALFFSIGILVLFRFFEKYKVGNLQAIVISYFISTVLALSLSFEGQNIQAIIGSNTILAIILGISFFFGFVFMSLSTQKLGLSITSVASNISILIPIIVAAIAYQEQIKGIKLAGLILALPAIYLFFKPSSIHFKWLALLYPIVLFFISGANNSLLRHAEILGVMQYPMLFLGIIFGIAFVIALIYTSFTRGFRHFKTAALIFGLLLGIFNFSGTYFFLKSLSIFSSALFFPVYNLSFIGFSALIGILFFNEKLTKANYIGLAIAAVAIMLMNWG